MFFQIYFIHFSKRDFKRQAYNNGNAQSGTCNTVFNKNNKTS